MSESRRPKLHLKKARGKAELKLLQTFSGDFLSIYSIYGAPCTPVGLATMSRTLRFSLTRCWQLVLIKLPYIECLPMTGRWI
jgi:hypothetical protein